MRTIALVVAALVILGLLFAPGGWLNRGPAPAPVVTTVEVTRVVEVAPVPTSTSVPTNTPVPTSTPAVAVVPQVQVVVVTATPLPQTQVVVVTATPAAGPIAQPSPEAGASVVVPVAGVVVKPIPAGESRPAGTLAVVRIVDHKAKTIAVWAGPLGTAVKFGPVGTTSTDGWEGYGSLSQALTEACGEAQARLTESRQSGSWCQGYSVTYLGGPVPDKCN
jgi:hypothetical protein